MSNVRHKGKHTRRGRRKRAKKFSIPETISYREKIDFEELEFFSILGGFN